MEHKRVKNYFTLGNMGFRLLLPILPIILFLALYLFATSVVITPSISTASRILFTLLGPLLAFVFYVSLPVALFRNLFSEKYLRNAMAFVGVAGVIGLLFAVAIESRYTLLATALSREGLSRREVIFFVVAFAAPLAEEFAKCFPLILITRMIKIGKDETEQRLLNNPRSFLLLAILSGGIFNIVESYLYIWSSGDIFTLSDNQIWSQVSSQIMLRSINPLHIVTTLLFALVILFLFWQGPKRTIHLQDWLMVFAGYAVATLIHGVWNGSLVLQTEQTLTYPLFGVYLPVLNIIMIGVLSFSFFIILYLGYNLTHHTCNYCDQWHGAPYSEVAHQSKSFIRKPFSSKLKESLKRPSQYSCTNCSTHYSGTSCPNCSASKQFICGNCKFPYPVYEHECWNCKENVDSVFQDVFNFGSDTVSKIAASVLLLFVGMYIPYLFHVIISLQGPLQSVDPTQISVGLVFLVLIVSAMLFSYLWTRRKTNPQMGNLLARYVFFIVLIQNVLFWVGFGLIISIDTNQIYSILIALLISFGLVALSNRFILSDVVIVGGGV